MGVWDEAEPKSLDWSQKSSFPIIIIISPNIHISYEDMFIIHSDYVLLLGYDVRADNNNESF